MDEARKVESEGLTRSWMQHEAAWLRDYLVSGVEDPRINVQSVLSRHFLVRALTAQRFGMLMEQEYRFAAVMNWLVGLAQRLGDVEELATILYALKVGADNAEGIEIPHFVIQTFAELPTVAGNFTVPNYVESFLSGTHLADGQVRLHQAALDTFRDLWRGALTSGESPAPALCSAPVPPVSCGRVSPLAGTPTETATKPAAGDTRDTLSVLEVACGSANDYRFLDSYGIAPLLNYTGFDLCLNNIENARALFAGVRFEVGNVFEIAAADKTFDLCFAHDLFEHLSLEGMQTAIGEICRVTRCGLCLGFFNMDEICEHRVRAVDEYHWNTLSMARMKELFAGQGFTAQVFHIGSFLRQQIGCEQTHNPNAYTFLLRPGFNKS